MFQQHELSVRILVAVFIVVIAVVQDIRHFKIPNQLILAGMISGIGLIIGDILCGNIVSQYILGFIIMLISMMVVYAIGGIGAGDAKLFAVIGLIQGLHESIIVVAVAFPSFLLVGLIEHSIHRGIIVTGSPLRQWNHKFHGSHFSLAILIGEVAVLLMAAV